MIARFIHLLITLPRDKLKSLRNIVLQEADTTCYEGGLLLLNTHQWSTRNVRKENSFWRYILQYSQHCACYITPFAFSVYVSAGQTTLNCMSSVCPHHGITHTHTHTLCRLITSTNTTLGSLYIR